MVIGIDIDGVLTDVERWQIDNGTKYCFENNEGKIVNPKAYYTTDMFDWSDFQDNEFWTTKIWDYAENERMRPYANEIISKLKEEGYTIYIITAREFTYEDSENGEKMRNIVKNWLKKNGIVYDKIFFSKEDKRKICTENNVKIMIEDSPYNIKQLDDVVENIICYDNGYNQEIKGKNVTRAYSWYDIYNKIKEIAK